MKKAQAKEYGENLGSLIDFTLSRLPKDSWADYRKLFIQELNNYGFLPKKNGHYNGGCVSGLSDMVDVDSCDAKTFAKKVKENIHVAYRNGDSELVLCAVQKYFRKN
jgi:hypothetical protein